ncbi:MAG: sensor histidine kinase, partial [Pseudomonas sp.]
MLAGTLFSAGWAMHHAKRQSMVEDASRASQQLGLYATSLHTLIERYRALPAVLALDPELINALSGPVNEQVQDALNRKLERINGAANSST